VNDNYFNYFTEVEEYFVLKRGKNILISPLDWCLVELWKENGIPLHIVLRGIDRSFEKATALSKRFPSTLYYCHPAVMEAHEEYQEATIGSHRGEMEEESGESIPRGRVNTYLEELERLLNGRSEPECRRAAERIRAIRADVETFKVVELAQLDEELGRISSSLLQSLSAGMEADVLSNLQHEVEEELKRYKKRLSAELYRQLKAKYLENKVGAHFSLPEFSLLRLE
jgi:hypothetical protein